MKLATTTGDFGAYVSSQEEAVSRLHECGFRYIDYNFGKDYRTRTGVYQPEWQAYCSDMVEHAKRMGVKFVQAHSPMGKPFDEDNAAFIADTARCIEACGLLGIPNIVVHSGYAPNVSVEETMERNKAFYAPLLEVAEQYNVNILTENFNKMVFDDVFWIDNATDLRALIDYVDHPLFHAVWDAGHGNLQEMPQHEELAILGRHVYALHVQDNRGDRDSHLMPFQGTLNLDSLMFGLKNIGYDGYFTFEADAMILGSRRPFPDDTRLAAVPMELKMMAEQLLYATGKHILTAYDCFEE
ncbi:MAG: sugar phosphate isomerase/epimerase [Clostridia bacterium]|nr:sugar phosphate isomerase/epimerase [Clostridia bacterium]